MALVMVLGLTQCRPDKGNEGDTQNGSKVKVSCVVPMNKGTRSEFDNLMTDGKIKWSAGMECRYREDISRHTRRDKPSDS